jgi:hypothetical protein
MEACRELKIILRMLFIPSIQNVLRRIGHKTQNSCLFIIMDLILHIVAAKICFERVIVIPIKVKGVLMNLAIHAAPLSVRLAKLTVLLSCWAFVVAYGKIAALKLRKDLHREHCGLKSLYRGHKGHSLQNSYNSYSFCRKIESSCFLCRG